MKKVSLNFLLSEGRYNFGLINPFLFSVFFYIDISFFFKQMIFIIKIIFLYNDINKIM